MPKKAKAAADKTLVTFLLDRSGSMMSIRDATIEAFNAYVDSLRDAPIDFTFLQFDSVSVDRVCVGIPVANAPKLDTHNFQPRASTPLIDACVKTIRAVDEALAAVKGKRKVVVCFQTDGEENCSTEHTWAELNLLIKEKTLAGWQFNFMGAGIDAYQQARQMGLSAGQTMSYNPTDLQATRSAFVASAAATQRFGSGMAASTNYLSTEKQAAGDKYDPALTPLSMVQPANRQQSATRHAARGASIVDKIDLTTP